MNGKMNIGDMIIIAITFILFVVALFVKGLTKDILLEAGVLLVSIKIIIMARKQSEVNQDVQRKLNEIIRLENEEKDCK
ncbi:MAG: hypothetical protein C0596_18060 [Marinilabiliales bacterium]|nr:MAG: hypothetical protein C0596_18060 [Marinilabiliales bacterium]